MLNKTKTIMVQKNLQNFIKKIYIFEKCKSNSRTHCLRIGKWSCNSFEHTIQTLNMKYSEFLLKFIVLSITVYLCEHTFLWLSFLFPNISSLGALWTNLPCKKTNSKQRLHSHLSHNQLKKTSISIHVWPIATDIV